jgi:hypothetical protein
MPNIRPLAALVAERGTVADATIPGQTHNTDAETISACFVTMHAITTRGTNKPAKANGTTVFRNAVKELRRKNQKGTRITIANPVTIDKTTGIARIIIIPCEYPIMPTSSAPAPQCPSGNAPHQTESSRRLHKPAKPQSLNPPRAPKPLAPVRPQYKTPHRASKSRREKL